MQHVPPSLRDDVRRVSEQAPVLDLLYKEIQRKLPWLKSQDALELSRVTTVLVREFSPERVYLFGSQARGDATPDSDVDLLVLMPPHVKEPSYRLAQQASRAIGDRQLPLVLIFMPRDHFEERLPVVMSLPGIVAREGKLLYDAATTVRVAA